MRKMTDPLFDLSLTCCFMFVTGLVALVDVVLGQSLGDVAECAEGSLDVRVVDQVRLI